MRLGLKISGSIALILLILFFISKLFSCFNQASDALVMIAIIGMLLLVIIVSKLGQISAKYLKKGQEKQ